MDMSTAFPSSFLKGSDVEDGPIVLTMASASLEEVGKEKEELPVVRFQDDPRGLVLNVTNNNFLIENFGKKSEGWFGKQVELYAIDTEFAGRPTKGLRVRLPKTATIDTALDDEVPF